MNEIIKTCSKVFSLCVPFLNNTSSFIPFLNNTSSSDDATENNQSWAIYIGSGAGATFVGVVVGVVVGATFSIAYLKNKQSKISTNEQPCLRSPIYESPFDPNNQRGFFTETNNVSNNDSENSFSLSSKWGKNKQSKISTNDIGCPSTRSDTGQGEIYIQPNKADQTDHGRRECNKEPLLRSPISPPKNEYESPCGLNNQRGFSSEGYIEIHDLEENDDKRPTKTNNVSNNYSEQPLPPSPDDESKNLNSGAFFSNDDKRPTETNNVSNNDSEKPLPPSPNDESKNLNSGAFFSNDDKRPTETNNVSNNYRDKIYAN